jgi:tetratricopeptide (TPR) repeat protein
MGSVMKAQENFDGALPIFLNALTIIERQAPHHPDVARCLNNIGFAYSGKGESKMAIDYFSRALDFCREYLPPNNELTAISYLSLAAKLPGDQYSLAIDYFQQVLAIYNHIGLPHHKNVISCYRQWGLLHQRRHEHASALACYEHALYHCREAPLPEQHPLWVVIYTSFAHEHSLMGEYQQALKTYEQALRHITAESLELPRIHAAMDLCAQKIIEADVRQAMAFMLDKVVCLVDV